MTAKDFRLIAETIRALTPVDGGTGAYDRGRASQHGATIEFFTDSLARTNARFDRERFIVACTSGKESK